MELVGMETSQRSTGKREAATSVPFFPRAGCSGPFSLDVIVDDGIVTRR
jgi:hypothetical protein